MNTETTADAAELVELASLHHSAGRLEQADETYRAALAQDPENADGYNGLGLLALQIRQYDVAEQLLSMAVDIAPNETTFLCNLGTALYAQNKLAESEDVLRHALTIDEHCATALLQQGIIKKRLGDYWNALKYLDAAVVAAPERPEAFAHLADALMNVGKHNEAENIARAAVNLDNRTTLGLFVLASALTHLVRPQDALPWARRLLGIAPGIAIHHRLLAECLLQSGLQQEGLDQARKAAALDPNNIDNLILLAQAYSGQGRWEEALQLIDSGLSREPGNEHLVGAKARLLERVGNSERAYVLLKPFIEKAKAVSSTTFGAYLVVARRLGKQKEAAKIVERALGGDLTSNSFYGLLFTAGSLYDDLGQYDKAFSYFERGNRLKPRVYQKEDVTREFVELKEVFDKRLFDDLSRTGTNTKRPIFVVGMPRSGTSLTEQIIGSHPKVFAAGELQQIQTVAIQLPDILESDARYPYCVKEMSGEKALVAAQRYLDYISEIAPNDDLFVTDKMPQNFMHLGLIATIFPNAKIIHCNRNPMDTCFSCYSQNFTAAGLQFAYDLKNLGHYYRLYRDLMAHWRQALPIPVYELSYERLVTDREAETARLLDFCGLEWDDACLDHTSSGIQTFTASYDQVRQPVYTRSVERWRHYEKHLQPLIDALGDDIVGEWL